MTIQANIQANTYHTHINKVITTVTKKSQGTTNHKTREKEKRTWEPKSQS